MYNLQKRKKKGETRRKFLTRKKKKKETQILSEEQSIIRLDHRIRMEGKKKIGRSVEYYLKLGEERRT